MSWVCEKCEGCDVQSREWTHLNNGEMCADDLALTDLWCPDCDNNDEDYEPGEFGVVWKEEYAGVNLIEVWKEEDER